MKKIIKEFREFAVKGNVIELATAVIIGGAFGKIVSSLVADIVMPLISLITGGTSFNEWRITLRSNPPVVMNVGIFIQNIVDFLLIAAAIFLMVKLLSKLKDQFNKKEEEKKTEAKPSKEEELLTEIRDILKNR